MCIRSQRIFPPSWPLCLCVFEHQTVCVCFEGLNNNNHDEGNSSRTMKPRALGVIGIGNHSKIHAVNWGSIGATQHPILTQNIRIHPFTWRRPLMGLEISWWDSKALRLHHGGCSPSWLQGIQATQWAIKILEDYSREIIYTLRVIEYQ